MFDAELHDLYTKLNDTLALPTEEVNEMATRLLDAPEDQSLTREKRLKAIAAHPNASREILDRLLNQFSPETLTSEDSSLLHLLVSNENATLEDLKKLSEYATQSGKTEWLGTVLETTVKLNEYQLGLSYNGVSVVQDRTLREQLIKTISLLKGFQTA
jgi:hypothetical protein